MAGRIADYVKDGENKAKNAGGLDTFATRHPYGEGYWACASVSCIARCMLARSVLAPGSHAPRIAPLAYRIALHMLTWYSTLYARACNVV